MRTTGSNGPATMQVIRRVGLDLIFKHGYGAMTLRMLADGVGITQGALYNHFRNKQDLLCALVTDHMVELIMALDRTLAGIEAPLDRLDAFVAYHVTSHMVRKKEVFVGNSELRALSPPNLAKIVEMRADYEARLSGILQAGVDANTFIIGDIRLATFALLSMLTGVCSWYRPRGRLSKSEIVGDHIVLARRLVGAPQV